MRRFSYLTHRHRTPSSNLALGLLLALNAGAINAGGYIVLQRYTSHMTGFASQVADGVVLSDFELGVASAAALVSFTIGAATTSMLVNFSRRIRARNTYALPLLLEAALLFPFGVLGTATLSWQTPFAAPATVLLLCFIMGLQNAIGSKTSAGTVRTTHMTGNITDVGIELGKMLYWNRREVSKHVSVRADVPRLQRSGGLLLSFILGGMAGAAGFQSIGFVFVTPFACLLFALAWIPARADFVRRGSTEGRHASRS